MDEQTLRLAMTRYGSQVYRVAWSYSLSRLTADDVYQETFLELWRTQKAFVDADHLRNWLLRVAANKSKDILRSKRRKAELLTDPHDMEANDCGFEDSAEGDASVWGFVARLPRDMRVAVVLYYGEGYSTEEIAGICRCSPTTVRTRLHRARRRLRKMLEGGSRAGIPRAIAAGE